MKKLLFLLISFCFFSPDKKRVTIALSKVSYGFEGELDVSLEFIGCSLNPKTFK